MERITYFFNSDFESKLFNRDYKTFQSSKSSQEFEFFIHLLSPDSQIYTLKNYSKSYLNWIYKITEKRFLTTRDKSNVYFWWGDFSSPEKLEKIQQKSSLAQYLMEQKMLKNNVRFVTDLGDLRANMLYKDSSSFSGRGHYLYPRDQEKLFRLLSSRKMLLEESIFERCLDFSALCQGQNVMAIYENEIDDHFQYKGTYIGYGPLEKTFQDEFEEVLDKIRVFINDYKGVYSVDSFLYKELDKTFLYPACEINARKTMGYIAFHLKQRYFSHVGVMKLKLIKNRGEIEHHLRFVDDFSEKVLLMSPLDNYFYTFIILGEDRQEVDALEKALISRFFKRI